ncbi:MAG: EamA family transporter [Chloroflexota bacterium]
MNLCFYASLARVPLGIAVTLECLGPLGLAIVGSRRRLDLLWAVLAGSGVLLLTRGADQPLDPVGVGFGLAAGALWATYIVLSARTGSLFPGGDGLAIAMIVAALLLLPAGLLSAGSALLAPRALGLGLVVALLSSAIPYSLEMETLRRLPPRAFGVLMSLEPALGVVVGAVALAEAFGLREIVAVGLVMVASLGTSLGRTSEKKPS